jgi:hypothetical protein
MHNRAIIASVQAGSNCLGWHDLEGFWPRTLDGTIPNDSMDPLFEATVQATEEAQC